MLQTLLNLFSLLAPKQKFRLLLLQFLVIISSFLEVISVLSIGPFMTVVADPEIITSNAYFGELKTIFGLSENV
jgi:HlyD family secretion protein